jgi:biotin synthase
MPRSRVRLSAGRLSLNHEAQLLAFFTGANSIFIGDKLLTTPNVAEYDDQRHLAEVGA